MNRYLQELGCFSTNVVWGSPYGSAERLPTIDRATRTNGKKGKLGTYAMKRVTAGAHLPTPWLFEPAKRPDDRAD